MVGVNLDSALSKGRHQHQHGPLKHEIAGLIRVFKDGHVERPQMVPFVSSALPPKLSLNLISTDISIDNSTNIWARFYVPTNHCQNLLPLLVYFHGGGFCVGSPAWTCYHEFLAKLAAKSSCIIMSINYRLAPENPLPAAYHDGIKALMWLKQKGSSQWWSTQCNFSNIFLGGDSAGGNIAYNILKMLGSKSNNELAARLYPLNVNGGVLIQPFFGGEERSNSEKYLVQSEKSALSLETSDTYWRLALPYGASRDHPWCNPQMEESVEIPIMVCIAEMDILRDRNMEFGNSLGKKRVVVHKGVGHGFQVLSKSQISHIRTLEMMSQINNFIN
ncbi:probable carboxylesterase 6 [Euphorbia lathyris]|uniref:probable carboxylesterase 6 n=1 Tax=Euphorbia lathyris TaxID=212925 RepID=UPI0033134FCD